jgi:hypothetical protein
LIALATTGVSGGQRLYRCAAHIGRRLRTDHRSTIRQHQTIVPGQRLRGPRPEGT